MSFFSALIYPFPHHREAPGDQVSDVQDGLQDGGDDVRLRHRPAGDLVHGEGRQLVERHPVGLHLRRLHDPPALVQ